MEKTIINVIQIILAFIGLLVVFRGVTWAVFSGYYLARDRGSLWDVF